mgnify:CR=1 FL=1
MVKSMTAFQSSDKQMWETEEEALLQELRLVALQIVGGNVALAEAIVSCRDKLLEPLLALEKFSKEK